MILKILWHKKLWHIFLRWNFNLYSIWFFKTF